MKKERIAKKPKPTHSELLRENARLRGDLLTVAQRICHDLRTPLAGIVSASEVLKEILVESDPSAVPLVNASLNAAEDLAHYLRRVSAVMKATAGPRPMGKIAMSVAVSGAWQRLESAMLEKGATVIEPKSWPEVQGISDWLEVVWWNLLTNALQHAGPSPRIELGWSADEKHFRFWISDNGPGVADRLIKKLFQPFHTLHETDAVRGVGLSVVHRLVELHGGSCYYESRDSGGAHFFFVLPAV